MDDAEEIPGLAVSWSTLRDFDASFGRRNGDMMAGLESHRIAIKNDSVALVDALKELREKKRQDQQELLMVHQNQLMEKYTNTPKQMMDHLKKK